MALKLQAEVGLNAVGFERGLQRLGATASNVVRNQILTAFGAISFANLVRGTIDWASKLQDSADALGVNVELLQKLQNGAKAAGGDIEEITKLILQLNRSREAALQNPAGPEAKAFQRFGFNSQEISGLSTGAFVQKLVGSFSGGVSAQAANDLQVVGGRTAKTLIAAFANQFQSDAPIAAEKLIQSIDNVGDEFAAMKTTLMVDLAPAIKFVVDVLHDWIFELKVFAAGIEGFLSAFKPDNFKALMRGGGIGTVIDEAISKAIIDANNKGETLKKQDDAIKKAQDAAAAARRARENSPPEFDLSGGKPSRAGTAQAADSLVSVGNFLGSNGKSITSLAEQQLEVARQQLALEYKMYALAVAQAPGIAAQVATMLAFPP